MPKDTLSSSDPLHRKVRRLRSQLGVADISSDYLRGVVDGALLQYIAERETGPLLWEAIELLQRAQKRAELIL